MHQTNDRIIQPTKTLMTPAKQEQPHSTLLILDIALCCAVKRQKKATNGVLILWVCRYIDWNLRINAYHVCIVYPYNVCRQCALFFYTCTLQRALHVLVPMCWLLDVMKLQKLPKWLYFPCILIVLHQSLQGGAFDRSVWTYCFPLLFFVMQWDFQRDSFFFLEYRYRTQYEGSWNMQQHSFSI